MLPRSHSFAAPQAGGSVTPRAGLRLTVATPLQMFADDIEVVSLRAEDASGSFGIRTGHADFVTLLSASVVRWCTADGVTHFCAVDGGVMRLSRGCQIEIACREAIVSDSLECLEAEVHRTRAAFSDAERRARVEQLRLHAQAVRQILRYLRPAATSGGLGAAQRPESLS